MSQLLLIRHAQASFLATDYDNLSEKGLQQSTLLGYHLADQGHQFDHAYVGTLRRQQQTYQKVKEAFLDRGLAFPEATILPELNEYEGMDTMGTVRQELMDHHDNFKIWFKEMDENPNHKTKMKLVVTYLNMWATGTLGFDLPKDAQTYNDFKDTAHLGLEKIMSGNEKGKSIAAFSSGGCIAAMLGKVVGTTDNGKSMGFNLVMRNTAINEVLFSGNRLSLKTFNTLPHLTEEMITTM